MTAKASNQRDLAIRCSCGALRGTALAVSPREGNHVVCYCDDCQAFAHFLTRPMDILDGNGGTEIFQMSPARLVITTGADQLACMRLTQRGMLRWYTACCKTPVGNTLTTDKLPFVGLIHTCIERPADALGSVDDALGPIQVRAFRQFAKGDRSIIPADRVSLPLVMLRFAAFMLKWKLRGDTKRTPFFEPGSRRPVRSPQVLSAAERAALSLAVGRP
jgi:hypothetical protein